MSSPFKEKMCKGSQRTPTIANVQPNVRRALEYWVYVIELDRSALAARDQADAGKGAVYVGYTSTTPEVRLEKHQEAGKIAGRVFKRMSNPRSSRLRMDLSLYAGPYTDEAEARRNEKRTHNRLASDGYKVFGDLGKKVAPRPRAG